MSLYGALFGGVSGLSAQGSKIAIVSDNIANVNTVGYKQSQALFETLVINSASTVSYQTGGVRAESRMLVDKQGLLLSTTAPTDIALSGSGFFSVNAQIDGSGQPLYTRAGSFRQDSLGNFVNAQGFYLQGWPLDREGRLPGEAGNLNTTSFANLDSLETVNVESASGVAQATTQVRIGANLDAGETVYPGEAGVIDMDANSTANFGINAEAIIVPDEFSTLGGMATANDLNRGDRFEVVTGNGLNYQYEYGGFSIGRDIVTGASGDALLSNARTYTNTAANEVVASGGGGLLAVTIPNHGLVNGDEITLSGLAAIGATPVGNVNSTYTVTVTDANTVNITLAPPHGLAGPTDATVIGTSAVSYDPFDATGNIFDANNPNEAFFGTTGTTRFTTAALSFTISRSSGDTHTFTYRASPNTLSGQFNSLTTLATAINEVSGLSARVVDGQLVVGAEDASEGITFANGDWPPATFSATQTGIDWITELDLVNVETGARRFSSMASLANIVNADAGVTAVINNALSNATVDFRVDDPLDTIQFRDIGVAPFTVPAAGNYGSAAGAAAGADLVLQIDINQLPATAGIQIGDRLVIQNQAAVAGLPGFLPNTPGIVTNGTNSFVGWEVTGLPGANVVEITIPGYYISNAVAAFGPVAGDGTASVSIVGETNQGSVVSELGLTTSLNIAAAANNYITAGPQDTGVLGPQYDPSGTVGENMASGDITAQFSRNARIYDGLGAGHDIRLSYLKTAENTWAVEVHAIPETDVNSALPDGQIAIGTIQFNGDGSLRSVSSALTNSIEIVWTNGAIPSDITIDWGTAGQPFGTTGATVIGDTNGLSQFDSAYDVDFIEQNGAPVGELVSVTIDEDGFVIASYTNGETQNLYKLPIAEFTNANGLRAITGNVFAETRESGTVNLREAGTSGTGDIVSAALEQSNVELSEQLTDLIVAQRAYQSNTRVISATDELLEQLNNL